MARSEEGRIPELDGWRVLLVFLVSWYHIWQQSWLTPYVGHVSLDFLVRSGYMPVDGTILLSGFLLFLPWAKAMRSGGPLPSARAFYQRRVARIVPSYVSFTLLMLFVVAIPQGSYGSDEAMLGDLAAHFTFTFTFFRATYLGTPLGAASWTLCVEAQMYLLFPWIARLASKKPLAVILGLCAAGAYFRMWVLWRYSEYNMVVNQLAAFLDVYGIGMALALLYVRLKELQARLTRGWPMRLIATVCAVLAVWGIVVLLKEQASSGSYPDLQAGQLIRRMPFALLLGTVMVALPFAFAPLRLLMGNPVTRFLSSISMNYYLIHQPLAVYLKRLGIPYSEFELPNQAGDRAWMYQYTFLCFGLSLLAATLMTYLVEKPAARGLKVLFARRDRRRAEKRAARAADVADGLGS